MVGSWSLLLCIVASYLSKATCQPPGIFFEITEDFRRPIWNVAHMVNSLRQVEYYLNEGANGIEIDVSFDAEGFARYTYHGVPCDCFRSCTKSENIVTFLEYLKKITTPGTEAYNPKLVLLIMDVKVHGLTPARKIKAGQDFARKLIDHYWKRGSNEPKTFIVISVPSIKHIEFVNSFRLTLKDEHLPLYNKIGFDFSGNEDLDSTNYAFEKIKMENRIWQGDGITNCLPRSTSRLRDAIRRRDQQNEKYIKKVYWWTVDKMATMKTTLDMGVDAMITNYPDRLISILNEYGYSDRFRLATYEDNPYEKYEPKLSSIMNLLYEPRGDNITDELGDEDEDEELLYNC